MFNTLTVCIPVYNTQQEFLIRILDDLSVQTFKSFDVLVQDDSSTTDYSQIYENYITKLNLYVNRNEHNVGMVKNWNKVLASVNTKYFIILGHDDGLAPDALEKLISPLEDDEQIIVSSCSCHYIDPNGIAMATHHNINHRDNIFIRSNKYLLQGKDAVALCLNNGIALGELTCQMFRTNNRFQYDINFFHAADLDYFLARVTGCSVGKVAYNTDKLIFRRLHKNALTEKNYLNGYVTLERERIFKKYCQSYNFTWSEINRFRAFLLACAYMDLMRFPKHKSTVVIRFALSQILRHTRFSLFSYLRVIYSIVFHINLDSR